MKFCLVIDYCFGRDGPSRTDKPSAYDLFCQSNTTSYRHTTYHVYVSKSLVLLSQFIVVNKKVIPAATIHDDIIYIINFICTYLNDSEISYP